MHTQTSARLTILKVLNNNAVVAQADGDPIVATGNGIGFQRSPGDIIPRSQAQHIFVSTEDNSMGLHSSQEEKIFAQILVIIEKNFHVSIDTTPEVKRFHAHIMYLLTRINSCQQLQERSINVEKSIREAHPRASEYAIKIGKFLYSQMGIEITSTELMYLALHISRVVATSAPMPSLTPSSSVHIPVVDSKMSSASYGTSRNKRTHKK